MINELEAELCKISPAGDRINTSDLARSVMALNCKIRNRDLSASEIPFARDFYNHSNLNLNDQSLSNQQKELRYNNQQRLIKSRAPNCEPPIIPTPGKGDIVFMKANNSKHSVRDPHIVTGTVDQKSIVRKALHVHPNDRRALNLATKPRIVENKFLFRPLPFNRAPYHSL